MLKPTEIPKRLMSRPKDRRGFPIPYVAFITPDGEPDFRIVDQRKSIRCVNRDLCGLCGQMIIRNFFFIGGPRCAEHGLFFDPPMHRECAVFALQTCPHLAIPKAHYSTAALPDGGGAYTVVVDPMASTEKAERHGLMHTTKAKLVRQDGHVYIRAKLPWAEPVQWWRHGKPLERDGEPA